MSYATLAGYRASSLTVSLPLYGIWVADVVLPVGPTVSGLVTLVVGSLTLVGTPARQTEYAGDRTVRLIGGRYGWQRDVVAKGYANTSGVRLADVLSDVAAEVGEAVTGYDADATVGEHYARLAGVASRVLRDLAGALWYVRPDGVTSLAPRPSTPIVSAFQVISRDGPTARTVVATETPEDWMPGRRFASVTTPDLQTISHVSLVADESGKLRAEVLTS
jgi:hypothetical protein